MKAQQLAIHALKVNLKLYGLSEETLTVLCMVVVVVLLLLLLLLTVRCGRTVLGSPYQGVGAAASCPQVTRLLCSVHQSLAPSLISKINLPP